MATKKQTTPTGTTVPPSYSGGGDANSAAASLGIGSIPVAAPTGAQPQRGNAIGVPPYATDPSTGLIATYQAPVIDPATGQPAVGGDGKPLTTTQQVPWTAQVQRMIGGSGFQGVQTQNVLPKYYEGDIEQILNNMPPEMLAKLQGEMIDARVYGSKNPNIVRGIADQETTTAFRQVLTAANATGLDYETVIQNYQKIAKNAPPAPPAPHVNVVTNTTDLMATFKAASRSALGRELSDSEAKRYADVFQGTENAAQNTQNAATDLGTTSGVSSTVQAAPSPGNFIDAQLKANQPGEYGANRIANQFDAFQSIIRGPAPPP